MNIIPSTNLFVQSDNKSLFDKYNYDSNRYTYNQGIATPNCWHCKRLTCDTLYLQDTYDNPSCFECGLELSHEECCKQDACVIVSPEDFFEEVLFELTRFYPDYEDMGNDPIRYLEYVRQNISDIMEVENWLDERKMHC